MSWYTTDHVTGGPHVLWASSRLDADIGPVAPVHDLALLSLDVHDRAQTQESDGQVLIFQPFRKGEAMVQFSMLGDKSAELDLSP